MNSSLPPAGDFSLSDICANFPITAPFRFIDELISADADRIEGTYRFRKEEYFYGGHFPGAEITPGSIVQESAAQIGLLAFGIFLLANGLETYSPLANKFITEEIEKLPFFTFGDKLIRFYLVESNFKFKAVVLPGDKIIVHGEKKFFKLNKLKAAVKVTTEDGKIVAQGEMSGMINVQIK